ncbi:MAG: glycerol-3-phosphate 1-O-acyltransferase PlsY [Bdellovibrionales bacterium]|nr:glycerol-3-phosphate 1-O-acyltransferase PlsY [Bdellovibrionales bacterium]
MQSLFSLLAVVPFYLFGCFPSGTLVAKAQGIDLSKVGSGNVGATNVARTLGKKAGVMTLMGDIAKGFLAVILARLLSDSISFYALASVAAVAGHCFSIPGKLKGGKGVATALGCFLGLYWPAAIFGVLVFFAMFGITRIVSAASIASAFLIPVSSILLQAPKEIFYALSAIGIIVVFRHRENIDRLIRGTESKFQFKK